MSTPLDQAGKRGQRRAQCAREGCPRTVKKHGHRFCAFVCEMIAVETDRAQRVCEAIGADNPMAAELWAEAVAMSDARTRYVELDYKLYQAARSVGITDEQWTAIKDGHR